MPTKPPGTPTLDLTDDGDFGIIGDAVFMTGALQSAGTGQFNSFVQIQHTGTEQGYNTDASPQFDEKSVHTHNHSVLLADIPIVVGDGSNGTAEGVTYREFLLDLNEKTGRQFISLDELQIWQEESGSLTNFTSGAGFAGAHTNYLAYDLDAGGDHWIALTDGLSHGSGESDYRILIPDSFFIKDAAHRYVTLYSEFGLQSGWRSDGGVEEWGLTTPSGGAHSALAIQKTATVPGGTADTADEVVSYAIAVSNTGNTALTGITVTDSSVSNLAPVLSAGFNIGDTNQDNQLSAGETWQYTASHTVTQSDIDSNGGGDGVIDNLATADSNETSPVSAAAQVAVDRHPGVDLTKAADVTSVDAAGDQIHYTITVVNSGNTTLSDVQVTDTQVNIVTPVVDYDAPILGPELLAPILVGDYNAGDTNQNGFQDPGETFQYANAGDTNQNGTEDPGETFRYTNVGDTNQDGQQDPGETFQYYNAGDTNHNGFEDDGETFQFTVSHAVAGVDANEDGFNDGDINHDGQLNVGETWQFALTYTVTQADIDNGNVLNPALTHDNTATVTTSEAEGATDTGSVSVGIVQNPAYSIVKAVTDVGGDGASGHVDAAGDVISYSITVSNDGNMTLTGVTLDDALLTGAHGTLGGPVESLSANGNLDVGETWTYSGTYTAQQSDINNNGGGDGDIDNTATVHSDLLADQSRSVATPIDRNPAYSIHKSVTDVGGDGASGHVNAAGDVISYQIVVNNDGNVDLTGTSVTDALLQGANGTLGSPSGDTVDPGTLNVGETWTYSGSYTAQQSDIDNNGGGDGDIDNTATVHSTELADQSSSVATPIDRNPAYSIHKSVTDVGGDGAGGHVNAAGDVISYQILVNNDGNVDLAGVSVTDALLQGANGTLSSPSGDTVNPGTLDVGETWTYTGSYTAQQADIDNNGGGDGDIDNTATVHSTELADQSSSTATPVDQPSNPSFTFSVTALGYHDANGNHVADNGDTIDFSVLVNNTGNMTLTGIGISNEDGLIAFQNGPIASLAAGASDGSITGTHLIQGGETSLTETEIGQSDQVGNVLVALHVEYNTLIAL